MVSRSGRSPLRALANAVALGALTALLLLLLGVARDLRHDRVDGGADEGRAVVGRPVARLDDAVVGALEVRHDVARDQFVALQRGFTIGPLVCHLEEAAETAGLLPEALDLCDR